MICEVKAFVEQTDLSNPAFKNIELSHSLDIVEFLISPFGLAIIIVSVVAITMIIIIIRKKRKKWWEYKGSKKEKKNPKIPT